MIEDKQTCCFLHLIHQFLADKNNYLLSVKEYKDTITGKVLLGYYDDEYIYLIPSVVIGMCDTILIQHNLKPFDMQKILQKLFALNLIKVHWILTDNVRYRPEKRIGSTRKRYITFIRRELKM